MNDYDIPQILFSLKEAMIQGKEIDEKYIIPSLYLNTMNDLYNSGKNKEVTEFAYKALEKEEYMDDRIIFEFRYLLCAALAKLRNQKFLDEVMKLTGAEHEFLFGFYYRQIGKFDKALERINKSLGIRPNMSKAKREKVQIYIAMQEYQVATELAKENYYNYKENPYHIQAYFNCIIRADRNSENKKVLKELISSLEATNSEVSKEMALRCKAQFVALYDEDYEHAMALINTAIKMNDNIQYARLVKFEICEKFDDISGMQSILEFFKQPEYKQRYYNNVICFESIIMAKNGQISKAVKHFQDNIRSYTDEAKERFIAKLHRY